MQVISCRPQFSVVLPVWQSLCSIQHAAMRTLTLSGCVVQVWAAQLAREIWAIFAMREEQDLTMPGLPNELHSRCQNTLLQCNEFDSHSSLRAVFATDELYPFRSGLPESTSKSERIAKCLDYLLEQRGVSSQPVLAIFLTTLRDRYMTGNALRDDLEALAEEVADILTSPSPTLAQHVVQVVPTTGSNTITWLHLSDFHFRATEQHTWNENVVLRALLEDIQACITAEQLKPNFILVSGDLAFGGATAEYALAHDFLERLRSVAKLPKDRLFIIPGNHDIDRNLISRGAQAICDSLTDRDSANAVLATPADRQLVFARFDGYAAFINDYFSGHLSFDDEHYSYVHLLDLAGQCIAIMGLNSAWVCASDQDKAKGLLIGERQVRSALDAAREAGATLRIALLHHPFDWLREFDQSDSAALLLDNCDFILHGHLHQTAMTQLTGPDSAAMIIGGGASHKDRRYANRYSWVRLDLSSGIGTVYLRRYSDERGGFWAKDTLTYRNVPDGTYPFSLPARLAASQGKPQQTMRSEARASRVHYRQSIDERKMRTVVPIGDLEVAANELERFWQTQEDLQELELRQIIISQSSATFEILDMVRDHECAHDPPCQAKEHKRATITLARRWRDREETEITISEIYTPSGYQVFLSSAFGLPISPQAIESIPTRFAESLQHLTAPQAESKPGKQEKAGESHGMYETTSVGQTSGAVGKQSYRIEQAAMNVVTPTFSAPDSPIYDLGAMRHRLNRTFDDVGLDAFCLDHFSEVYDSFSRGMRKDEKINLLLDYCRRLPARYQRLVTALEG